ncbi:MAG: hypothetical protein U0169_26065 [Polyangiaceae bacterium]
MARTTTGRVVGTVGVLAIGAMATFGFAGCSSAEVDGESTGASAAAWRRDPRAFREAGVALDARASDAAQDAARVLGDPGAGPGPTCDGLPVRDCTGTTCDAIVPFEPVRGPGYENYPINGETAANQYRSFARKDLVMLIQYATAFVACKAASWTHGTGGALGLGDMSEANGAIPGTSIGSPGHPAGTHVNGFDMDIGYFQVGTTDNRLREVCAHSANGRDAYHCTAAPTSLDVWRTSLFIGALFSSPRVRVIGVDGKVGPLVESTLATLCDRGFLAGRACTESLPLAYEPTDTGRGWFLFHHHHLHISLTRPPTPSFRAETDLFVADDAPSLRIAPDGVDLPAEMSRLVNLADEMR